MANPRPCGHGTAHSRYDILEVDSGLAGNAVAVGTFTFTASSSSTTVSDGAIRANSQVLIFPTNATAGLHLRSNTVYVDTIAAGSFVANISATAAGVPAAASTWAYIALSRS